METAQPDLALLDDTYFILAALVAYLLGSVPFAVIISKFAGIGDIRNHGSGNPGATNMTKVAGKKWGAVTLVLDVIKGVVAVLIAREFGYASAGVLFVVLGHCFSVFLKFRGGKGVATTLGALLALNPQIGLTFIGLWLAVFALFRISSLAALSAITLLVPLTTIYWPEGNVILLVAFLAALIIIRHHSNIRRLMRGEER